MTKRIKEVIQNSKEDEKFDTENPDEQNRRRQNDRDYLFRTFPWFRRIVQICAQFIGNKNMKVLESLIYDFLRKLHGSVKECYTKPNKATKLKTIVNQMLIYFRSVYEDIRSESFNMKLENSAYLGLMVELVAIYIDLEIKASRREDDRLKDIGKSISTALFMFLDESENHIAEALLRANLITQKYEELCLPVLSRFLTTAKCCVDHESEYLRFLLNFKLWSEIQADFEEKKMICELAACKLKPASGIFDALKSVDWIQPAIFKIKDLGDLTCELMDPKIDFMKSKKAKRLGKNRSSLQIQEFFKTFSLNPINFHKNMAEIPEFLYTDLLTNSINSYDYQDFQAETKSSENEKSQFSYNSIPSYFDSSNESSSQLNEWLRRDEIDDSDEVEIVEETKKNPEPILVITIDSDEEIPKFVDEAKEKFEEKKEEEVEKIGTKIFSRKIEPNKNRNLELDIRDGRDSKIKSETFNVQSAKILEQEDLEIYAEPYKEEKQFTINPDLKTSTAVQCSKVSTELKKENSTSLHHKILRKAKYESLAKYYKIVKSVALKNENFALVPKNTKESVVESKQLRQFNFASKFVKITEEELKGNKPARAKSWKSLMAEKRRKYLSQEVPDSKKPEGHKVHKTESHSSSIRNKNLLSQTVECCWNQKPHQRSCSISEALPPKIQATENLVKLHQISNIPKGESQVCSRHFEEPKTPNCLDGNEELEDFFKFIEENCEDYLTSSTKNLSSNEAEINNFLEPLNEIFQDCSFFQNPSYDLITNKISKSDYETSEPNFSFDGRDSLLDVERKEKRHHGEISGGKSSHFKNSTGAVKDFKAAESLPKKDGFEREESMIIDMIIEYDNMICDNRTSKNEENAPDQTWDSLWSGVNC